jgi:hypothetical protein
MSLQAGVELPRLGLRDPSWSPLYSVWYYVLSIFEADRVQLYYLNYKVLVVTTTALFYLLLRAANTNLYLSALASIWLLLSTVTSTWPHNGLFAVAIVLLCLNVMARISSEENSYLVLGLTVAVVVFVRPEFLVSLVLMLGWLALYYWGNRRRLGWLSATKIVFFVGAVVVLLQIFGNPMGGGESKAWPAFGQHYSINYVRWHGLAMVPWFEWQEIVRASFGDATTSALAAAVNNSGAFAGHLAANAGIYILATIVEPMIAPLAFLPPRVHGALALLQFGMLIGLGLFLIRAIWRDRNLPTRVFPRRLVVAAVVVLVPNLMAALLFYPRWHYLALQTVLLLAGTAALLSEVVGVAVVQRPTVRSALIFGTALLVVSPNAVWGWLPPTGRGDRWLTKPGHRWSREREQQIAARRFAWSFPSPSGFMNYWTGGPLLTSWQDAVVPTGLLETRAVIDAVRSLRIDVPVHFLGFLRPYRAYLGDNYHDVSHLEKAGTPFPDFVKQQEINMIWVSDRLTNSPSYADDPGFGDYVRDPSAHGFRRIEIPAADSWLLVGKDLW